MKENILKVFQIIMNDSYLLEQLKQKTNMDDLYDFCTSVSGGYTFEEFCGFVSEELRFCESMPEEELQNISGGKGDNKLNHRIVSSILSMLSMPTSVFGATSDKIGDVTNEVKSSEDHLSKKSDSRGGIIAAATAVASGAFVTIGGILYNLIKNKIGNSVSDKNDVKDSDMELPEDISALEDSDNKAEDTQSGSATVLGEEKKKVLPANSDNKSGGSNVVNTTPDAIPPLLADLGFNVNKNFGLMKLIPEAYKNILTPKLLAEFCNWRHDIEKFYNEDKRFIDIKKYTGRHFMEHLKEKVKNGSIRNSQDIKFIFYACTEGDGGRLKPISDVTEQVILKDSGEILKNNGKIDEYGRKLALFAQLGEDKTISEVIWYMPMVLAYVVRHMQLLALNDVQNANDVFDFKIFLESHS